MTYNCWDNDYSRPYLNKNDLTHKIMILEFLLPMSSPYVFLHKMRKIQIWWA